MKKLLIFLLLSTGVVFAEDASRLLNKTDAELNVIMETLKRKQKDNDSDIKKLRAVMEIKRIEATPTPVPTATPTP